MWGSGRQGRSRAPGSGQCELSAGSEQDREAWALTKA